MLDVSIAGALAAGLLSFLSPCILPIVPFYLSYLAGVAIEQISEGSEISSDTRRKATFSALAFAAGIITIFVALGATASVFGQLVRDYFDVLRWIAAAIIIAMGVHFLGLIRIGFLYRQYRADIGSTTQVSLIGAYILGLAFAFGWTPCVGPVLAAILFTAAGTETAWHGALLLFVYGAGMTAPFVLAAILLRPFMRWVGRFRKHLGHVEKAMGGILILFGLLIATDSINLVAQWMLIHMPWLAGIG